MARTASLRSCRLLQSLGNRAFHAGYSPSSTENTNTSSPSKNVYQNATNFKSNILLAQHLHENIFYHNLTKDRSSHKKTPSGVIVINKPYGVPTRGNDGSEDHGMQVSLEQALPHLQEHLNLSGRQDLFLEIVKSPGRYCSGPLIVQVKGGEIMPKRLDQLRKLTRISGAYHEKYLVLTQGSPLKDASEECADLRLEKVNRKNIKAGTGYEPVIFRELFSNTEWWKGKMKKDAARDIKRFSVKCETLAKSEGDIGSLVSIEPTTTAWNFIQAYMAEMLSPIIGDFVFSYRVQTIMSKRAKVSHRNAPVAYDESRQSTPAVLLKKLGLSQKDQDVLPLHVHLFRTSVLNFFGDGEHLTVHAPPPKHFAHSCQCLGIRLDFDQLVRQDQISFKKDKHSKARKLQQEMPE